MSDDGVVASDVFDLSSPPPRAQVVTNSSLTSMKKSPENWTFSKNDEFIRKGIIGDWRSTMSEDQARRLDQRFLKKCSGSGALHLWAAYDIPGAYSDDEYDEEE